MGVLARRWGPEAEELSRALERPTVWPGMDAGRPIRFGVVHNPRSGSNRRPGRLAQVREQLAHARVPHCEADTLDGIIAGTNDLLANGAEVIAVNGGDGTVQAVLTGLLRSDGGDPPPLLAVLPGGTTNTTARNVGYGARGAAAIARLAEHAARGRLEGEVDHRSVVRVQRANDPDPLFAMFFGAGAVYHGIRLAKEQVESRGMRGQLGAAMTLAVFLGKVATGEGGRLFPPLGARISLDGTAARDERLLGLLVSTMDRQVLNLRPYWGEGTGALRFTSLAASPRHVFSGLLSVIRGRPTRHTVEANGYRSRNADRVELELDSGFTLDGELFSAGPGGRLVLQGDRSAFFLRCLPGQRRLGRR